jgi:hypothetical protein
MHLKISLTLLKQNQVPPCQVSAYLPPALLRFHRLRRGARPAITLVLASVLENAYKAQQNTASAARPVSAVDGPSVLPPVPESRPFSFVDAFSSDLSAAPAPTTTAAPTVTTPSQPSSAPDAPNRPSPGIKNMTFVLIIELYSQRVEEGDTALIVSFKLPRMQYPHWDENMENQS